MNTKNTSAFAAMGDVNVAPIAIPSRHRAFASAQRRAKRPGLLVRGGCELTESRWRELGESLNQGDPLADALVIWMQQRGKKKGGMQAARAQFEQALASGISSVSRPAKPLRAFFEAAEQKPDWVDDEMLALGSRVFQRAHPTGFYVLRDAALMVGYLASPLNKPLLMTGALQGGAQRRMAQTMKWGVDCTAQGGLEQGAQGYRSTLHVRLLHAMVRKGLAKQDEWDSAEMGLPINQPDMAATYLGFSVVLLLGLKAMGVPVTPKESRAVMHLWSYACYLMGVDEKWLCHTENDGRRLLFQWAACQPAPDESTRLLGQALMDETEQVPYPALRPLKWRLEKAKHLSTTSLFAGPKGMKALGLPVMTLPWYPLATAPLNFAKHLSWHLRPAAQRRAELRGRRGQEELVQLHFGVEMPSLAKHPSG